MEHTRGITSAVNCTCSARVARGGGCVVWAEEGVARPFKLMPREGKKIDNGRAPTRLLFLYSMAGVYTG